VIELSDTEHDFDELVIFVDLIYYLSSFEFHTFDLI